MISENKHDAIDRAWEKLQERLNRESLLNEERTNRPPLRVLAWSMSIAAVLIAAFFVIRNFTEYTMEVKQIIAGNTDNAFWAKVLEDGSVVYMQEQAVFSYPAHFDGNKREVMLTGEAFFDVKKNDHIPFRVETPFAYIEVLGTTFAVKSLEQGDFTVSVSSGEVKVVLKNSGHTVHVKPGESVTLETGKLRTVYDEKLLLFEPYYSKIYFKDTRLEDIVDIVNKQHGQENLVLAPGLEDRLLTATFAKDDPAIMAKLICIALDLHFSERGGKWLIHETE